MSTISTHAEQHQESPQENSPVKEDAPYQHQENLTYTGLSFFLNIVDIKSCTSQAEFQQSSFFSFDLPAGQKYKLYSPQFTNLSPNEISLFSHNLRMFHWNMKIYWLAS